MASLPVIITLALGAVHSNTVAAPRNATPLRASTVQSPILVEPRSPIVIQYRRGEVYRREARLIPRAGSGVKVQSAKSDSPLVKASLLAPSKADGRQPYSLQLVIGPHREAGDFSARIHITTSDPRSPQVILAVVGLATTGPAVSPIEVYAGTLRSDQAGKVLYRMQVVNRSGPIRVTGVDTGNAGLKARVIPTNPGHFYEIVLTYAGGWKKGPVSSTIRVRTDDKRDPVVTVPFHANVQ